MPIDAGRQGSLGELELLIMFAVARLGDDAFGGEIQTELGDRADRRVTISTIYVTLMRLGRKGLVDSTVVDPTPVRGGKARRRYRLTALGVDAVKQAHRVHVRMWAGVKRLPEFRS